MIKTFLEAVAGSQPTIAIVAIFAVCFLGFLRYRSGRPDPLSQMVEVAKDLAGHLESMSLQVHEVHAIVTETDSGSWPRVWKERKANG